MEKITASLVMEILGRPIENVSETLNSLVEKLSKEKGVFLKDKKIHAPVKIEGVSDLFTSFAEVEVELDTIEVFFYLMFAYMPSHVELIHPDKITLQNQELTTFANVLVQRLHNYDGIAKNYLVEREMFLEKLKELSPETFKNIVDYIKTKGEKKS